MDQLTIERQAPVIAQYDAVVCGGGPAGWVAAVSAARNGCRTALIEKMSYLGGTPTAGLVDPISGGYHKGKRVLGGVGWEFVERLVAAGAGQVELPKGHVSFDPEYYKLLAQRMVLEAGVELYTNTVVSACQMADGRVTHVLIESKDGLQALAAGTVIDATGDGLVCRRAGVPMQVSAGGMQPMSLCFLLRNVDVTTALLRDHIHHTGLHGQSKHMGIYHALQKLAKQGEDVPQFGGPWFNSTMQEDLICVNITRAAACARMRTSWWRCCASFIPSLPRPVLPKSPRRAACAKPITSAACTRCRARIFWAARRARMAWPSARTRWISTRRRITPRRRSTLIPPAPCLTA